jgi:hypothetical protein
MKCTQEKVCHDIETEKRNLLTAEKNSNLVLNCVHTWSLNFIVISYLQLYYVKDDPIQNV